MFILILYILCVCVCVCVCVYVAYMYLYTNTGLPIWLSGKRIHLRRQELQETRVPSLGTEEPLEKEVTTHSTYPCLENPMDRGPWRATIHRVAKSQTRLSMYAYTNPKVIYYDTFHIAWFISGFKNMVRWQDYKLESLTGQPKYSNSRIIAIM